jgi:alpha-L-rhamnosidase
LFAVENLKCDFAVNPLGTGSPTPRLSWTIASERGVTASAYRVRVASSEPILSAGGGDLWDTGRVEEAAAGVQFGGKPLSSRQRVFWTVEAWSTTGQSHSSPAASFEMGLLSSEDWHAEWIGFPGGRNGKALYFKSVFEIDRPVARARAYVAGLGWHEFRMNGHKVGDAVLEPAQTAFDKRVLYVTHDITEQLRQGSNIVGAIVGNGWHGAPKLLVQIEIDNADGTTRQVLTGRQIVGNTMWNVADGPIVDNSIYDGEIYDARLEKAGWDSSDAIEPPGARNWWMPMLADSPGGELWPQTLEPIRVIETRKALTVSEPQPGVFVFDGGQNLAGWVKLRVSGARGTAVTLRFAESLYTDGTVNQENLRGALARDIYILKGGGPEEWEPTLTYHGFRYVQVEGFPGEPTLDSIEIKVVRSDVARTARFASSSELLNRIDDAVIWTESSNLHGVPTDCPQRDERMGWLNDMAARSEELVLNFDVARLLPKWMDDIADAQDPRTGAISDTAPFRWGSRPADPVSVCFLLIPRLLHRHYGDTRTMARHFGAMQRWVDYLATRAPGQIVEYSYYGDWAPPIAQGVPESIGSSAVAKNTPGPLVSTGHYFYAAKLLSGMATTLGRTADAARYAQVAEEIHSAFNDRFWDPGAGVYGTGNQACNALALYMGLVPPDRQARAFSALVADIEKQGFHLTTGNLCTKYALEVLAERGRLDVAFRVATRTDYPSWGYMFARGATTMWERWEEATGGGMNSHNHPMYASIGAWLHRWVAGIRLADDAVAASDLVIAPQPLDGLASASSELRTVRGKASASWRSTVGRLELDAEVPSGTRARFRIRKPSPRARLTESGSPATDLRELRETDSAFEFETGGGFYRFCAGA